MAILPGRDVRDPQLTRTNVQPQADRIAKVPRVTPRTSPSPSTPSPTYNAGGAPVTSTPAAGAAASGGGSGTSSSTPGSDLTAEMLTAVMAQIAAQYGMTEQQLLSDEGEIGRQYRLLFAEASRMGEQQAKALQAGMVDRGIVQSGIYADEAAKQQALLEEQMAAYEAQQALALQRIASEKALLPANQAAAEAAAAADAAAAGLDLDLIKASAG